ncbi:MAG: FecR family protein [Nitrospirales bacterium]
MPRSGNDRIIVRWLGVLMILVAAPPGWGHDAAVNPVGQVTAVQGRVIVAHSGDSKPLRVNVPDEIVPHDVIQTDGKSRSKILFQDDTLLTIGENSIVEIAEHTYDSSVDIRSVTLKLAEGKLRALVGRIFGGQGSTFIVRTPTAFAASQGTYFVVWTDGAMSGVANIGTTGQVSFTSGSRTVVLNPGQFTVAAAHTAPATPSSLVGAPADVNQAVALTEFKDAFISESAKDVLRGLDRRREPVAAMQWSNLAAMHTPPAVISGAVTPPVIPPPPVHATPVSPPAPPASPPRPVAPPSPPPTPPTPPPIPPPPPPPTIR